MTTTLSSFETALEALDVVVTRVDERSFGERIDAAVTEPAVGVSIEQTFDDPAFSLAETTVTVDPTPTALRDATTGVTGARLGVADYGSVVLSPTRRGSELVSLFVDRHVVVVRASDIVPDMATAVDAIHEECIHTDGSAIVATGPSATADMGALVTGAHGPRDVHVLVVEAGA